MEEMLDDSHLIDFGFKDGDLITDSHKIHIFYYDIWRLIIAGKPSHTGDSVYIEDYFTVNHFIDIVEVITGHRLTKQ